MSSVEKQNINRSAWTTLIILSSLGLITMYGETMVLPAIPDFIRDFNISYSTSSWILSSYLIAGAVMTPIAGKLSDIYGKKKILLIVMAIYSSGILAGGFANSIGFMLAARTAQGVGISMFPIAFGIIREIFPEKKLAIAQTLFSSTFSGGAVVGLLVGASIIQNYGWHATFFSVFPVAVVLALIIARFVRIRLVSPHELERASEKKTIIKPSSVQIDLKGALALAATIVSFLAGLTYLENGVESTRFVAAGLFTAAAVSLALFLVVEKRTDAPLIDMKLMTHRTLLPAIIILMIVGISTFMVYQTIPIMVSSPEPLGFGGDAVLTASVQLPFMIILLIGTVTSGFALARIGNKRLTAIGTIISTIGFFSLFLFHSTESMVSITLAIISAGLSLSFTGGFNIVLLSAPIQATGMVLGMTLLLNMVGTSIGPSVAGMYQQMYQASVEGVAGQFPSAEAYNLIFLTAALVSMASVVFALNLYRRNLIPASTPDAGTPSKTNP